MTRGNHMMAPITMEEPWQIWVNKSNEFTGNNDITTTKKCTTQPYAYHMGHNTQVYNPLNLHSIWLGIEEQSILEFQQHCHPFLIPIIFLLLQQNTCTCRFFENKDNLGVGWLDLFSKSSLLNDISCLQNMVLFGQLCSLNSGGKMWK